MSRFKESLALTATVATLSGASLYEADHLSRSHNEQLTKCEQVFDGKNQDRCEQRVGTDYSSLLEMAGFAGVIVTALTTVRTLNELNVRKVV